MEPLIRNRIAVAGSVMAALFVALSLATDVLGPAGVACDAVLSGAFGVTAWTVVAEFVVAAIALGRRRSFTAFRVFGDLALLVIASSLVHLTFGAGGFVGEFVGETARDGFTTPGAFVVAFVLVALVLAERITGARVPRSATVVGCAGDVGLRTQRKLGVADRAIAGSGLVRIVAASAFWRNDHPDGLGVTMTFGDDDGIAFAQSLLNALPDWDAGATVEDNLEQLAEIAKKKGDMPDADTITFLDVHWLVTRGHLVQDEHNGIQWILAHGDVLAVTEQNPLTIDVEAGIKEGVDVTTELRAQSLDSLRVINDWARQQKR